MRARRAKQILALDNRIDELTEAIQGVDEDVWDEIHFELVVKRAHLAWQRSDLIKKNLPRRTVV